MPSSAEAVAGPYNPQYVRDQKRDPPESVNADVNQIANIPIQSAASNVSKPLIIGGVSALVVLAVCAGVIPAVLLTKGTTSSTTTATSSTSSSTNSVLNSTAGSSSSNSTNTTVNSGTTTGSSANATAGASSNATATVSTSSSSIATTVAAGFSASGAVAAGTTAYYGYEQVVLSCSTNLNNLTITIYVQKTVNATYSGAYSTYWGGTLNLAYVDSGTQIIYTWTIISGQTIQSSGSPYTTEAQFSLYGVNQTTSADLYTVRATTTGGVTSTVSGHF